ncbi:MAG: hypothetical protein IKE22_14240 [Atopobiaceae bacterium]|nr:hypothetical protein [Atopobiaceae bacterium]
MKHVYYIPDCPACGAEMVKTASYDGDTWTQWWRCGWCNHESERVPREKFDELTRKLTADLREGDEG